MKFKPGDRIFIQDSRINTESQFAPVWGGEYGKILGTVLQYNDKEYAKLYPECIGGFPLKVKWDNGYLNGFTKNTSHTFVLARTQNLQLKLF